MTVERGNWFVLFGENRTTPYYEYYLKVNSGYSLNRVNALAEGIIITETNTEKPVLKIYKTSVLEEYKPWVITLDGDSKYRFSIPEGTLKKDFRVG